MKRIQKSEKIEEAVEVISKLPYSKRVLYKATRVYYDRAYGKKTKRS